MRTRKTNSNDRATYKYTSCVRNEDGSYSEGTIEIKPGENGVTEADIKMLHSMDDSEVYYNNKNLRPTRTVEEKAEIEAWKEEYIQHFNLKHVMSRIKMMWSMLLKSIFHVTIIFHLTLMHVESVVLMSKAD